MQIMCCVAVSMIDPKRVVDAAHNPMCSTVCSRKHVDLTVGTLVRCAKVDSRVALIKEVSRRTSANIISIYDETRSSTILVTIQSSSIDGGHITLTELTA